jgi:photosystem II stability/assembly factor-like uncharacterized protein
VVGRPLGIRSMSAACDGTVLLVNVHVGGIPRSADGGLTWQPTIEVNCDVHQVAAHATQPDVAVAASAAGVCLSRDAGATWSVDRRGLHAYHCSAVALGRNDLFISAAAGQFAEQSVVYRRPLDGTDALQPLEGGIPKWLDGIVDTDCIATRDSTVALIDNSGSLYVSHDDGVSWSASFDRVPQPSALFILA